MQSTLISMYGINNCDTIKKAKKWFSDKEIDVQFHDFKKEPLTAKILDDWLKVVDWTILLNKRGMMWRKLSNTEKEQMNAKNARLTMLKTNSIIKRPILAFDNKVIVGFNETEYSQLFKNFDSKL